MARDQGPQNCCEIYGDCRQGRDCPLRKPTFMKRCEPPCPDCQTPWTCDAEQDDWQGIEMYDTPFQLIDDLMTWVRFHFVRIVAFCAAFGFVAGVYLTYFWS